MAAMAGLAIGSTLVSGYMNWKGSKQKTSRVPSLVNPNAIRSVASRYGRNVSKYLNEEPGLSRKEKEGWMEGLRREGLGAAKGGRMRLSQYMSQRGIRGPGAAGQMRRLEESRMSEMYNAKLHILRSEHAIRQSDIAQQSSVAAAYLWPAESARGAGQISSISQVDPGRAWMDAMGVGTRMWGEYQSSKKSTTNENE